MKIVPEAAGVEMQNCAEDSRTIPTWLLEALKCDFLKILPFLHQNPQLLSRNHLSEVLFPPFYSPLFLILILTSIPLHTVCLNQTIYSPCLWMNSNNQQLFTICYVQDILLDIQRIQRSPRPRHFPSDVENPLKRIKNKMYKRSLETDT